MSKCIPQSLSTDLEKCLNRLRLSLFSFFFLKGGRGWGSENLAGPVLGEGEGYQISHVHLAVSPNCFISSLMLSTSALMNDNCSYSKLRYVPTRTKGRVRERRPDDLRGE